MPLPLGPALEPSMEALLSRLVPGFDKNIEGAHPEEVSLVEGLAGGPLPLFYRWFLARMGRSMGPFAYSSFDFSVTRIISCYTQGIFEKNSGLVMIGYGTDQLHPTHIAYDLNRPLRDDARVVSCDEDCVPIGSEGFETFREKLAYGALFTERILGRSPRFSAVLGDELTESVAERLNPVMLKLGFASPIETGPYCLLQEREDAVMVGFKSVESPKPRYQAIDLVARDDGQIRSILGAMVNETGISISEEEWL